ncbi:MAG: hypothetical protein ACOYEO_08715 [bacterium]|jgi:hypothetical protein
MNSKTIKLLSIVTIIVAAALNFPEFLMGSPAIAKNIVVTAIYIAIGILVLVISTINNSRRMMTAFGVFWSLTLLFALLTAYVNLTDVIVDWAIPFVIVLLGPWYGISFFTNNFFTASIVIALISFGMSVAALLLLQRMKHS